MTANDIKFPSELAPVFHHHIATLSSTGELKMSLKIQSFDPLNYKTRIKRKLNTFSPELVLDTIPKPVRQVIIVFMKPIR